MKRQYIYIIAILASAVMMTSCEKWLDETASSEIREEAHFSTEEGFRQSLIGCYINMTDNALYGKDLSWGMVEMMARQFTPYALAGSTTGDYYLQNYGFTATSAVSRIEATWAQAYNVIANANAALANIDAKKGIMDPINYNVYKGEFLAIRAYMHFELMRLFGYGNWAGRKSEIDGKYAVPYVTVVSKNPVPQVKSQEFFKLLIADLETAAELLGESDPLTGKKAWNEYADVNIDGFYNFRSLHLNYYAVKALMARAYLWEGSAESKVKALAAAEEVIEKYFSSGDNLDSYNVTRWMNDTDYNTYPAMALEQIFALNINPDKFTNATSAYLKANYADTDESVYYLTTDATVALYENSSTDYRLTKLLYHHPDGINAGYAPLKLQQNTSYNKNYSNRVALIRMPEMYYIAAECYLAQGNVAKALELLTVVRNQRGVYDELNAEMSVEEAQNEIKKEYHKEFLCEGVMFYYYKRTGAETLPLWEGTVGDEQYVLPYPTFEIQNGRIQ